MYLLKVIHDHCEENKYINNKEVDKVECKDKLSP